MDRQLKDDQSESRYVPNVISVETESLYASRGRINRLSNCLMVSKMLKFRINRLSNCLIMVSKMLKLYRHLLPSPGSQSPPHRELVLYKPGKNGLCRWIEFHADSLRHRLMLGRLLGHRRHRKHHHSGYKTVHRSTWISQTRRLSLLPTK